MQAIISKLTVAIIIAYLSAGMTLAAEAEAPTTTTPAAAPEIANTETIEDFKSPQNSESIDSITVFVPTVEKGETVEHSQLAGKTGTEVTTVFIDGMYDFEKVIEKAQALVTAARAENPNLPRVHLMIVTNNMDEQGNLSAKTVGRLIERELPGDEIKFEVRPTLELLKLMRAPEKGEDHFEKQAYDNITRARTSFSILRGFVAGAATGIGLVAADIPIPTEAIFAGSVMTAFMSGNLQINNDYYKNWVVGKAFWDTKDHHESESAGWKSLYFGWKILKESTMLTGYLAAMHFTVAAFGAPTNYFSDPMSWISATVGVASFAAVTETPWIMYDGERREQRLKMNWITHFHDPVAGEVGARRVLLRSQKAAVVLSAVATFAQILAIGSTNEGSVSIMQPILNFAGMENARELANSVMIGLGISGGGMYLWKCTNILHYSKQVLTKIKSGFKNACSSIFG